MTLAHVILADANDALDGTWWWIVGSLIVLLAVLFYLFNYFLIVRLPLWLIRHTLYRVHVHGAENVPATGPALIVSNHVSHIDAGLILAAQKRRIRFIIWAPFLGVPVLRWLLKFGKVIPIQASVGPRAIVQALRAASDALAAGDVVCIFAEGGITRTGFLLPFQRGMEQIVKRTPVPIIPVCLDHVWGSIFSYQGGRFFWKLPQRLPYHVHVSFGQPLPPTSSAAEVRQAIQRLWAETAVRRGPTRKPVHWNFLRMAVKHPFRPCFVDTTNTASPIMQYGRALAGAKILARHLRPVLKDDAMVGLWLPPSAGGALANIALAFLGKTAVNLNYSSTHDIVQAGIRQCGIKRVLTSKLFLHKMHLDPGPGVELVFLEDFRKHISKWEQLRTFLGVLLLPGFLQEMLQKRHSDRPSVSPADDVATVIFSSGSTGDPKGVMLSHANIAGNVESMIQGIDIKAADRLLGILPFFHSFGYSVTLWAPLQVGASTVFYPNPLAAREIGEVAQKYQVTIFLATPTFLRSYLRRCEPDNFKSVRILMCGAEKLPQALAQEFKAKFGIMPLEGYGCTELSPAVSANVPDWQQDNMRQVGTKYGTIGQPLPGIAVRVVHKETLQDLPIGQEGLLLVYGANVMKGYLGKEDLTKKKIVQGGWYITGDLAMLDEDGFITITGREERFAKVGGEMVPLEKVEEEIHTVLKSNDRLVAVTAIPDAKKGERIVVLHLPAESLNVQQVGKELGERGLPNLYIPGPKDWYQVETLPILGSGKLDLKKCKQMAQDLAKSSGGDAA